MNSFPITFAIIVGKRLLLFHDITLFCVFLFQFYFSFISDVTTALGYAETSVDVSLHLII